MATPVVTPTSSQVSTGDPTRGSHYNNLRADMLRALTEFDYGTTANIPGSPEVAQYYLDTDDDVLYVSFDGATFTGVAAPEVIITNTGLSVSSTAIAYFNGDAWFEGAVAPVGADKWVS